MSAQGRWCAALVEGLHAGAVRHAVICPGSRSTPLALALEAHPSINTHVAIDERSAGFFALGIAKADGRAAAVLTTSGTAVANLLPAVVEASQSNTPLVVVTADRPPERQGRGANQTIDQRGIFGTYLRYEAQLPPADPKRLGRVRDVGQKAAEVFCNHPPGPVHVNVPLRKPLEPDAEDRQALTARAGDRGQDARPPWQGRFGSDRVDQSAEMDMDWSLKADSDHGVIVVGPRSGRQDGFPEQVKKLAEKLQVPIIADCLSGLRSARDGPDVVSAHDTFLADPATRDALRPHWILQFGRSPTSKVVHQWIEAHPDVPRIRIDDTGRGWDDIDTPVGIYQYDDTRFVEMLLERYVIKAKPDPDWRALWHRIDGAAWDAIDKAVAADGAETEAAMVHAAARGHDSSARFLGSSLPVRDWERFWRADHDAPYLQVYGNRGASGIDGSIATAAGIAAEGPCVAVVGDVAFQHDVGSLALHPGDGLILIVVQNGGGRIFEHLPIRGAARVGEADLFERLWLTPPGVDIVAACKAFGLRATSVRPSELRRTVGGEPDPDDRERTMGWHVVHVQVDGARSARFRDQVKSVVADAMQPLLADLPARPEPAAQP